MEILLPEGIRPLFEDTSPEVDLHLFGAGEDRGFDIVVLHPLADPELLPQERDVSGRPNQADEGDFPITDRQGLQMPIKDRKGGAAGPFPGDTDWEFSGRGFRGRAG